MISFLTLTGAMALVGGSMGYFIFPFGVTFGVKSAINLAENGLVYPTYMNPPFATKSTFYLYAIKNPRQVLRGAKMAFELKGPYVFETHLVRENIAFTKEGQKVAFDSSRKLVPQEDKSSANWDERMWLINPIMPGTALQVRSMILDRVPFRRLSEPIVFNSVNLLLDNFKERLIMRMTPRDILIGRKVELLESIGNLASRFGLASLVPPGPPQNTFGLAFVQNETIDKMEIWTGTGKSKERFAEVSKWRNKSKLDIWDGRCNSINGTNGELYKPLLQIGKPIRVFLGPLCRSFNMDPVGDGPIETGSGIRALEYELTPRLYMGARSNPANRCFCKNKQTYDCQYDGLISMGPCFFDAPIFFTRANFKNVDSRIANTIDVKSIEESSARLQISEKQSFAIEQMTGTVLEANLTLVALFKIVRQPYMRDLANVRNLTYAPLFSTTEMVQVPFKFVWQIYFLQKMYDYYKPAMGATATAGAIMLLFKYLFGGH